MERAVVLGRTRFRRTGAGPIVVVAAVVAGAVSLAAPAAADAAQRPAVFVERGQVVGVSDTATGAQHAFLWQGGVMTDLGTLSGEESVPFAVNERGQVVGRSTLAGAGGYRAFLWQRGTMRNFGALGNDTFSYAADINDHGQVVGISSRHADSGDERAFLWQRGTMIDLGAAGGVASGAYAVNDRGMVAGYVSPTRSETYAGVWRTRP
jgi:probable HAF family extracellular repeat protein